jgi:hypothetical protein
MGGFRLTGPNYIFKSHDLPVHDRCLCLGIVASITQEQETFLIKNYPKEIPQDFLKGLNKNGHHYWIS